jgi:hypothetical protein
VWSDPQRNFAELSGFAQISAHLRDLTQGTPVSGFRRLMGQRSHWRRFVMQDLVGCIWPPACLFGPGDRLNDVRAPRCSKTPNRDAAKDKWASVSPSERANILNRITQRMEDSLDFLAVAETWQTKNLLVSCGPQKPGFF